MDVHIYKNAKPLCLTEKTGVINNHSVNQRFQVITAM